MTLRSLAMLADAQVGAGAAVSDTMTWPLARPVKFQARGEVLGAISRPRVDTITHDEAGREKPATILTPRRRRYDDTMRSHGEI